MTSKNSNASNAFEEQLAHMKKDYILSIDEKLDKMERQTMEISKSVDPVDIISSLYRDVHSLKGTAGTYDLPILSTICHQLEDSLEEFCDESVETCFEHIDLMRRAVEIILNSDSPNFSEIEKELYTTRKNTSGNKLLVVIIDSTRSNTQMIQQILADYPVKFTVINDGLAALTRLLFVKFDLIISAKELPSLGGLGLISALQATNCANRTTHSIILSSSPYSYDGIDDALLHPIKRDHHFIGNIQNTIESVFPEISV